MPYDLGRSALLGALILALGSVPKQAQSGFARDRGAGGQAGVEGRSAALRGVPNRDSAPQARDTTTQARDTTTQARDTTTQARDTTRQARDTTVQAGDTTVQAGDTTVLSPDTTSNLPPPGTVRFGLSTLPLPFASGFTDRLPDPTRQRPELRGRARSWADLWSDALGQRLRAQRTELWAQARAVTAGAIAPGAALEATVDAAAPQPQARDEAVDPEGELVPGLVVSAGRARGEPAADSAAAADTLIQGQQGSEDRSDIFGQYADLGIIVRGRVELGGGWNRFRPCNVNVQLNCDPGLLPNIQPDIQFGARVGGTISDRINVSVDYDNRREFDAANNINVFYQGVEDEILQRLEVGDVSFPLPQSRYLTQGIPAGNFGFRATGQVGPIEFQTVWAQQKGDLSTRELQIGGGGQGFEQDATTILDDADYERGRFYFLFNPRRFSGYPDIDIQRLIAAEAPLDVRPASTVKVYRYEAVNFGIGSQIPEGFVEAIGVALDTVPTEAGIDTVVADTLTGLFRPLINGEDYILHQSGLWLQLRNTLTDQEGLAVVYIAENGDSIGTFNAEEVSDARNADPSLSPPVLELLKGINHRPNTATWLREMHHIYRVSASPGVVATTVEFTVSQGDPQLGNTFRAAPDGSQFEFIKIFGLDDDPTDNKLDASQLYVVRGTDARAGPQEVGAGPTGTYIVFPTLEPFKVPPPLRDAGALSGERFPLASGDQNISIYDELNDQLRRGSNLYLLTISYRQRFEGLLSTISLGIGGVRKESERVTIDGVELVRDEDYTINYDIGQIELREPERWFRNNPDARIHVTFEQKPLFQLAPTTVFGFQARHGLGEVGEINLIGLSQTEKTLQTRPEIGLEPSAVQLGGLSGRLNFQPAFLTQWVDALPGVRAELPSSVSLDGEVAVSLPTTNTQGQTFVEDFEGGPGFTLSMIARAWRLASAPSTTEGAELEGPAFYNETNASELVWQDQFVVQTEDGSGTVGGLTPGQIDPELQIQGTQQPEPVLFMTAKEPENRTIAPNPTPPPGPAWRSITTVISPNGQDFTSIEFLEIYVGVSDELVDSVNLILDLGTVSEDGFGIDSLGNASGIGTLNREVDPPRIFTLEDDIGLYASGCVGVVGLVARPLGDIATNCTNNNGLEDTEDLNQNSVLDGEERFFRYTLRLGDPTGRHFVRPAGEILGARFRLFKIPLREPDHRERVTDAEFQNIRHLRVTVTSNSNVGVILARGRFLGSRFLKRGLTGVVEGLVDTTSVVVSGSQAGVGPISTLDPEYVPPPGITDQVANRTDQFGFGGTSFNEQSLRISFTNLGPDQRVETFLQYPQTPRDFLPYRVMRVWALGRAGSWGVDGEPLRFIVKLGEDANNFYLFKTALRALPPDPDATTLRQSWIPEQQIEFERLGQLRTEAEEILLRLGGLPPDSVLQLWDVDVFEDGDSTYAVVIAQRTRAPNLAAIRQISLGVYNAGLAPVGSGELWVDDMRLSDGIDNSGLVGQVNLDVRASDFLSLNMSYASENPYFRQLAQAPRFQSNRRFQVGGVMQFGKFMPGSWGISMPLSIAYSNTGSQPLLLPRTDIQTEGLAGLRVPESRNLRMNVNLAKRRRTGARWIGWLIDNSALRFSYDKRDSQNSRSETEATGLTAGYSFRSEVGDVSLPLFPGFLSKAFFFLPNAIKKSRLRLTPQSIAFGTGYLDSNSETRRFEEIIALPSDAQALPVERFDERLNSNATIALEPFTSLTGRLVLSQDRELVPTGKLVQGGAARDLINAERSTVGGIDMGWETGRSLSANLSWRPNIATWLTPLASFDSRFNFNRRASFVTIQEGDTVLASDFRNSRNLRASIGFSAPAFTNSLFGQERTGIKRVLLGLLDQLDLFTVSWAGTLNSTFQRQTAHPTFGYQLALGGFDAFRVQESDTASHVTDAKGVSLSTGVRLPFGSVVSLDYTQNERRVFTPITERENRATTWPALNFRLGRLPLPPFARRWVQNIGFRTGYSFSETQDVVVGADQDRDTENKSIPFTINVSLTTGWSLSYNLTLTDSKRSDRTGVTFGDEANQNFTLSARFNAPSRRGTLRGPIRARLGFTDSDRKECRQLGGAFSGEQGSEGGGAAPVCEPFIDVRIRRIDVTVDTDIRPFVLGLQGSWRDTQSELGVRPGSTQLEISLFGQFLFESGAIR